MYIGRWDYLETDDSQDRVKETRGFMMHNSSQKRTPKMGYSIQPVGKMGKCVVPLVS